MKKKPLVSVRVVVYNSAKYIIDTLDSIKQQSYVNIELIVSDDKSTDNTVEICNDWFRLNESRFVRTKIITTEKNTGVVGNCNRSLNECYGEWEIGVAGDDILTPTAIEDFVNYTIQHPSAMVVLGCMIDVDAKGETINNFKRSLAGPFYCSETYSARDQFNILKKCFSGFGAITFINTQLLKQLGGFDSRFPMLEDYPLFIKLTSYGNKVYWMPRYVLKYRHHNESITGGKKSDDVYFNNYRMREIIEYKYLYKREQLNAVWRLFLTINIFLEKLIINSGNRKSRLKTRILFCLYKLLSPFEWYYRYIAIKQNRYNKKYVLE